jgi:hypothetical protein
LAEKIVQATEGAEPLLGLATKKALPHTFTNFWVKKEKKVVVSLDGGGVHGLMLIATYVLEVVEQQLCNKLESVICFLERHSTL